MESEMIEFLRKCVIVDGVLWVLLCLLLLWLSSRGTEWYFERRWHPPVLCIIGFIASCVPFLLFVQNGGHLIQEETILNVSVYLGKMLLVFVFAGSLGVLVTEHYFPWRPIELVAACLMAGVPCLAIATTAVVLVELSEMRLY